MRKRILNYVPWSLMVLCLGTSPVAHSVAMAAEQVIDAIEQRNAELYGGIKRPRNTRVITTSRPVVSEKVSRALLAPYEESGQILRYSDFHVSPVDVINHRVDTNPGYFKKCSTTVTVTDGRLTLTLGTPKGGSNTVINWLIIEQVD